MIFITEYLCGIELHPVQKYIAYVHKEFKTSATIIRLISTQQKF